CLFVAYLVSPDLRNQDRPNGKASDRALSGVARRFSPSLLQTCVLVATVFLARSANSSCLRRLLLLRPILAGIQLAKACACNWRIFHTGQPLDRSVLL